MAAHQVFKLQFALNLVSYAMLMWWYVLPRLRARPIHEALTPLVAFQLVRTLGLFGLVPEMSGEHAAQSTWAAHVAIGDVVTVVLAMAALAALRFRHPRATLLVWIVNVWGALDCIHAATNAVSERIFEGHVGAHAIVLTFGVPALVITHIAIFTLLLRRKPITAT